MWRRGLLRARGGADAEGLETAPEAAKTLREASRAWRRRGRARTSGGDEGAARTPAEWVRLEALPKTKGPRGADAPEVEAGDFGLEARQRGVGLLRGGVANGCLRRRPEGAGGARLPGWRVVGGCVGSPAAKSPWWPSKRPERGEEPREMRAFA